MAAIKKRKRFNLSEITDLKEQERIKEKISRAKGFWGTTGSSSANMSGPINVNTWVVRCPGCGDYQVENSMENSDSKDTEYYCFDCFKEADKLIGHKRFLDSTDQKKVDDYYRRKLASRGLKESDIFDYIEVPDKKKGFFGSLFS